MPTSELKHETRRHASLQDILDNVGISTVCTPYERRIYGSFQLDKCIIFMLMWKKVQTCLLLSEAHPCHAYAWVIIQ